MHLNPSTNTTLVSSNGSPIELVQDFKYLGGYTDSGYDMNTRIGQAWSALNSLDKVWKAAIKKETKLKVFKASVETILQQQQHNNNNNNNIYLFVLSQITLKFTVFFYYNSRVLAA